MVAVWMVQMAVNQIIDVIAVRHGFVPATGSVHMPWRVSGTCVTRRANVGVLGRDFDLVLVHMSRMHMVQMSIMQVIHMIAVLHRRMAAARPMLVIVIGVMGQLAVRHEFSPA